MTEFILHRMYEGMGGAQIVQWLWAMTSLLNAAKTVSSRRQFAFDLQMMRSILEYIGNASDKITKDQVREGVQYALPQVGDKLMPTLFEQLREEGRQEERKEGIRLALEVKYGADGLAFYERMKDETSLDTLNSMKEAIRNGASLDELKQLLSEKHS